jgi:hypothetical protein
MALGHVNAPGTRRCLIIADLDTVYLWTPTRISSALNVTQSLPMPLILFQHLPSRLHVVTHEMRAC